MYPILTSCVHRGTTNLGPVVRLDCGEGQTEGATWFLLRFSKGSFFTESIVIFLTKAIKLLVYWWWILCGRYWWKIKLISLISRHNAQYITIQQSPILFTYNNNQSLMIMMKDLFWWFVELIEIGIAWHLVQLFSLLLIFPKRSSTPYIEGLMV